MASASCLAHVLSFRAIQPRIYMANPSDLKFLWIHDVSQNISTSKPLSVKAKASKSDGNTKPNSVICGDCDGNGAVQCSQCKGSGVNSVDLFNGQFKAGNSCWLCGCKKEILCGNCNGAGFMGGFMSTQDE
ncbi:hypothetical protein CFOL_v3_24213 [Cephalotus follicularis]|uniref:BSD2 cysteine rich domain-containing protein n=1 Tax=Cephalotus follicularis TaxID=3775 RepID=A0A1Q3CKY1_CEPFO|nr:hypothetical protein CFOL_v3_24213 [Cephalotus follicularis]